MLNLYEILQNVLLKESVSSDSVNDAIDNQYQVIINYSDEENHAPKKRIIEPYAYGLSKAGNEVVRAYQYNGDTYRGIPKWKLFRLDRIQSWNPTDKHFNMSPRERGWDAEEYNSNGDKTMSIVYNQVSFRDNGDELYSPDDRLNIIRKNTYNIKNSNPINISQMSDNTQTSNSPTEKSNFNSDEFQKMLQRNLDITRKEKQKRGFSLSDNNDEVKNNLENNKAIEDIKDGNDENNNGFIENPSINNEKNKDNDEFQKMLQRNLDITRKEKQRRGFSLNK